MRDASPEVEFPEPARPPSSPAALRIAFGHLLGLGLATLATAAPASAQDAHYWSQQYGTRSELLGGTVVGSPQDLSTTYYNPGGLAFLEDQSFLLRALAAEYELYQLAAPPEAGTEFSARRIGFSPVLVTGTFPRRWIAGTLAWSFLTRQRLDVHFNEWRPLDASQGAPVGNLLLSTGVEEGWGGLTWAQRWGSLGVGATTYFAVRSQTGREELLLQSLPDQPGSEESAATDDYSYWHVRALAKIGAYWRQEGTSFGLTFTTPGLPLFGSGRGAFYRTVRLDQVSPALTEGLVVADPEVTYRSPMSVAVGSRLAVGRRGALYLTAEWFDSVERFRVLDDPALQTEGLGSSLTARLTQELESGVNFGVGAEYAPEDDVTVFASLISDYAATDDDPASGHSFANWDLFHGTVGAAFTVLRTDLTLGLSVGSGRGSVNRLNDVIGIPVGVGTDLTYYRWKIFFGFEVRSGSNEAEPDSRDPG